MFLIRLFQRLQMNKKFQTERVIAVSMSHLAHDTYTSFLAPMLPLLISKPGISLSIAGLLNVIRKIPSLSNPLIGLIADGICVRYFVIITPAVSAIAVYLYFTKE
ncbi:MAG: hypothetical protein DRH32_04215 [Deltaproteobacteria bacterium]|nr:MAG: hypothetical protein DRH32_04215 [Deltaproteobacteria bacterium]